MREKAEKFSLKYDLKSRLIVFSLQFLFCSEVACQVSAFAQLTSTSTAIESQGLEVASEIGGPVTSIDRPVVEEIGGTVHDEGQVVGAGQELGRAGCHWVVAIREGTAVQGREEENFTAHARELARACKRLDEFWRAVFIHQQL